MHSNVTSMSRRSQSLLFRSYRQGVTLLKKLKFNSIAADKRLITVYEAVQRSHDSDIFRTRKSAKINGHSINSTRKEENHEVGNNFLDMPAIVSAASRSCP